jgi:hypothetical protein
MEALEPARPTQSLGAKRAYPRVRLFTRPKYRETKGEMPMLRLENTARANPGSSPEADVVVYRCQPSSAPTQTSVDKVHHG